MNIQQTLHQMLSFASMLMISRFSHVRCRRTDLRKLLAAVHQGSQILLVQECDRLLADVHDGIGKAIWVLLGKFLEELEHLLADLLLSARIGGYTALEKRNGRTRR